MMSVFVNRHNCKLDVFGASAILAANKSFAVSALFQALVVGAAAGFNGLVFLAFVPHSWGVSSRGDELLTTGEAALLLRSSRQHVVDLCDHGRLAFVKVGAHRRIHRADIDAILRPPMTRDQLKALWLHRAVAGRLVAHPEVVIAKATANLQRLRSVHPDGMTAIWLDRWRGIFRQGVESVLETLSALTADAVELRQNSPFAGTLTETDRQAVLTAFAAWWRTERRA